MNTSLKKIQKSAYYLRILPAIDRLIKHEELSLEKQDEKALKTFCLKEMEQIPFKEVMKLTDANLTKQLKYVFSQPKAVKILSTVSHKWTKPNNFDIRHKETIRLHLKEYFELFFPELAKRMDFDTAEFKDKELIALFGDQDQFKYTDALILIKIKLDAGEDWILIHWEHMGYKPSVFEERMLHYFCGIYFQYRKTVLPIVMFTDPSKWIKPVSNTYKMELPDYPIVDFHYNIIKLKNYTPESLIQKAPSNPLVWAYLPLTDFPKEDRPIIKAKAESGVLKTGKTGRHKATLLSLIDQTLSLTKSENEQYLNLIEKQNDLKEVKMYESIEEWLLEKATRKATRKADERAKETIRKAVQALEQTFEKKSEQLKRESQQLERESQQFQRESQQFQRESQQFQRESQQFQRESQQFQRESQQFQKDTEQSILETIELGAKQRFGEKANNEIAYINKLNDIKLLFNIQKALWTTNSFNEFVKIYRA
jgi:Skp family chaperone for outer membrane proteins